MAAALWTAAWFWVARDLEDRIVRWQDQRRQQGWAVAWQALEIHGFPFLWEARFRGGSALRIAPAPSWFWRTQDMVVLRYRPWAPRSFDLSAPGAHRFGPDATQPESAIRLSADGAEGRMELDPAGRPARIGFALTGMDVARGETAPTRIERLQGALSSPPPAVSAEEPHRRPALHLSGALSRLILPETLKPVLGREIASGALDATLLGRIEPGPLLETLTLWRDDGGTVEIGRIALGWGPLSVDADGTLALDEALQPQAALSARISGYAQTVDALVRAGLVPANAAFLTKLALGAMAKTPEGGGPPRIEVPLTIQERRLYLGPVGLFTLPPIDWAAP